MKTRHVATRQNRLFGDPIDRPAMVMLSDDLMVVHAAFYTDTFENVEPRFVPILRNKILYKEHAK